MDRRVRRVVPARAALAGNPSDGFGGAVVALPVGAFGATVDAVVGGDGPDEGPTGLLELARAAEVAWSWARPGVAGVRWRVSTTIPRQVGLAGSSAVTVGAIEALAALAGVPCRPEVVATLALRAETEVLGIPAGLQDRVVQAHRVALLMDFAPAAMRSVEGEMAGTYTPVDLGRVGRVLLAWRTVDAEPSAVPHTDLRARAEEGDPALGTAMAELAEQARRCAREMERPHPSIGPMVSRSFDLRASIMPLNPAHRRLVDVARATEGVDANYAGSGGAVVAVGPAGSLATARAALEAAGASTVILA